MDEMTYPEEMDPDAEDLAATLPAVPVDPENLAPAIEATDDGKAWLKKKGGTIIRLVKADDESRKDWMEAREAQIKLFAGVTSPMKYPAEGGKEPHDPIVCRTTLQMWTRGCEQICPPKGNLIQVQATGPEDEKDAADRELHMNWQLRHKVPNYVAGHRESYLQFLMAGSVFRDRSWDPVLGVTRFDHLTADDVIVSYSRKDIDPLMRRVPRVTRVLRYFKWELEEIEEAGGFPVGTVERLYSREQGGGQPQKMDDSSLEELSQEIDGVRPPTTITVSEDQDTQQRVLYRVYTWMALPDQKRQRAVTMTVDVSSGITVDLRIREDEDPFDKSRFDAEQKLFELQSANAMAQYQMALQQHQALSAQAAQAGLAPPPEPKQPPMPPPPKPVKMVPIFNMLHYRLFPNPHGFYGLGVAYLLTNANELVNKLEAEYLLAARFANMQQGFTSKGALGKKGEVRLTMGKFSETELQPEEMGGIKNFQFPGPSEAMRKFIDGLKSDAYTLVADIDTLTGEAGPTNETKAAAQQRMSNATALMTAVAALYLDTMAYEPRMLAADNGKFMPDEERFRVTEPDKKKPQIPGEPVSMVSSQKVARREMYANEFDFTFTADQRLQTQPERVQNAMNLIDRFMNSPLVNDPAKGPIMFHMAFAKLFRALDLPEFEQALGPVPPPPAPPPPPSPMSQEDEIKMFFADQDHPVLPDDDDEDHITVMAEFRESPYFDQLSTTGRQLFERHQNAHVGQLYSKEQQALTQGDQNGQGFGTAPEPGMGAPGGQGGLGGGPGDALAAGGAAPVPGPGIEPPSLPM